MVVASEEQSFVMPPLASGMPPHEKGAALAAGLPLRAVVRDTRGRVIQGSGFGKSPVAT